MNKYEKIKKSRLPNETNDCSVVAVAVACRLDYKKAHTACAAMGRKNRGGMTQMNILITIRQLGFDLEGVTKLYQKNGSKFTPKTIGNKLKRGYYIAFVKGHVLPVVNGEVIDWTSGRNHRILNAYKVTKTRSK